MIEKTLFSDLDQPMNFFKNMTMAAGFLIFAKNGSITAAAIWIMAEKH